MRILFLTSGLEPGKDGVGDYTRLLAEECIKQGNEHYLISLNDSFVSNISKDKTVFGLFE